MSLTTLSTQTHLFPASGAEVTSTGDGVHVQLMRDVAEGGNNLAWTDPGVTFAFFQGVAGAYGIPTAHTDYSRVWTGLIGGGMAGEVHIDSLPVFATSPTSKMKWTLGVRAAANTGAVVITNVTVTFAQSPYPSPSSVTAGVADLFNSTYLGLCTSSTWATGAGPAADTGYVLASGTTANEIAMHCASDYTNYAYAVISATMATTGDPTTVTFYCYDFSCWSIPE